DIPLSSQERYDLVIGGVLQLALLVFARFAGRSGRGGAGRGPRGPGVFERISGWIERKLERLILGEEGQRGTRGNEPGSTRTWEADEAPAKRMETGAKDGVDPTPDSIREGTARMEEHPDYISTVAELERLGFRLEETGGDPHVTIREWVNPEDEVLRVEKIVY